MKKTGLQYVIEMDRLVVEWMSEVVFYVKREATKKNPRITHGEVKEIIEYKKNYLLNAEWDSAKHFIYSSFDLSSSIRGKDYWEDVIHKNTPGYPDIDKVRKTEKIEFEFLNKE